MKKPQYLAKLVQDAEAIGFNAAMSISEPKGFDHPLDTLFYTPGVDPAYTQRVASVKNGKARTIAYNAACIGFYTAMMHRTGAGDNMAASYRDQIDHLMKKYGWAS